MTRSKRVFEPRIPTTFSSTVAIRAALSEVVQVGDLGVADVICSALLLYFNTHFPRISVRYGLTPQPIHG